MPSAHHLGRSSVAHHERHAFLRRLLVVTSDDGLHRAVGQYRVDRARVAARGRRGPPLARFLAPDRSGGEAQRQDAVALVARVAASSPSSQPSLRPRPPSRFGSPRRPSVPRPPPTTARPSLLPRRASSSPSPSPRPPSGVVSLASSTPSPHLVPSEPFDSGAGRATAAPSATRRIVDGSFLNRDLGDLPHRSLACDPRPSPIDGRRPLPPPSAEHPPPLPLQRDLNSLGSDRLAAAPPFSFATEGPSASAARRPRFASVPAGLAPADVAPGVSPEDGTVPVSGFHRAAAPSTLPGIATPDGLAPVPGVLPEDGPVPDAAAGPLDGPVLGGPASSATSPSRAVVVPSSAARRDVRASGGPPPEGSS
eukprot:CAMPEP_0172528260 /NCGR_PEP_ID=MMETSP1067-20121228/2701_1 /TAXON_ID=265564 ORGANISM="Thalassiosira punctigera, Strain Tpunct2005C2" /NCGR_SAMPLE_ID=MMETSP1067 /ASSEMBLY_ACC=CAM_ASM_000444 /LENGTH=365 /DNA_ID=CAMNT_0013312141 /DNA_START=237 /DNA_END=1333 /DNA_ORIENTATION=+